jgi:HPt (histidine-containing phosphotransfer) domain-containing protein
VDGPLDPDIVAGLRELAEMSSETTEQMRQLVETFLADAAIRVRGLHVAALAADGPQLMAVAHSLAGSAANLGATRLAEICRAIESAARSGAIGAIEIDPLQAEIDRAGAALRQEFGGGAAS